jgi:AcrR family transcriptional regulator
MIGVVPNAAYRHFADRDALLAAIREEAIGELSQRMAEGISKVRPGSATPTGARLRLRAIGRAYLDFARTEPGLFDTILTEADHAGSGLNQEPQPLRHVQAALDDLVRAGVLDPARRTDLEYPTWATVHGLAVLLRGPLSSLPESRKRRLESQTLDFIGASVS